MSDIRLNLPVSLIPFFEGAKMVQFGINDTALLLMHKIDTNCESFFARNAEMIPQCAKNAD